MSLSGERSRNGPFQPIGFWGRRQVWAEGRERGWENGMALVTLVLAPFLHSECVSSPGSCRGVKGWASSWLCFCDLRPVSSLGSQCHLGNRFQGHWKAEESVLVYRGRTVAFFFFLFLKSFFGNGSEPGLQQTSGRWDVDTNFRERGAEADMDADHSRGTPKPPLPLSPCSSLTPGKLASHL